MLLLYHNLIQIPEYKEFNSQNEKHCLHAGIHDIVCHFSIGYTFIVQIPKVLSSYIKTMFENSLSYAIIMQIDFPDNQREKSKKVPGETASCT